MPVDPTANLITHNVRLMTEQIPREVSFFSPVRFTRFALAVPFLTCHLMGRTRTGAGERIPSFFILDYLGSSEE